MVTTSIVSRIYMNTVPDVYSLVITHISRWSISSFLQVLTSTREPSWRWGLADIQYIWKTLLVKACSIHPLFTCKKSDCSHDPGNPCSLQIPWLQLHGSEQPEFSCYIQQIGSHANGQTVCHHLTNYKYELLQWLYCYSNT